MRVTVDRATCEQHGQCTLSAPDVFHFDDHGDLEYDGEPADDQVDVVEEAADVCPVQAIMVLHD
ncbi:MAG TPA: ferredoxin [Nocardioides sp.]|uniref:ferredoxin n=1 Tax=Nocardioides sp. TaxID=35761 RepID=UPI002E30534E|nr:ferredoxin [Nocardioides sp.]HEX3930498.1 ferredoxin [Nocardioides sp.]